MIASMFRFHKERPSATPTPASADERGQPKPKPRADSGTGIAAGIASPAIKGNPRRIQAQTNPNPRPNAPKSDELQLNAYCNSGTQHIKGLTNLTGHIKGNANGAINFGTLTASAATHSAGSCTNTPPPTQPEPDLQQKVAALEMLVDTLNMIDDGKNDLATSQPSSSHPPGSGKITEGANFNNTGLQNITGLINTTGYVEGHANGAINFGGLHC